MQWSWDIGWRLRIGPAQQITGPGSESATAVAAALLGGLLESLGSVGKTRVLGGHGPDGQRFSQRRSEELNRCSQIRARLQRTFHQLLILQNEGWRDAP